MIELYIDDKLVDLPDDFDFGIDYSIAKIGEIETRSGARSAEVNLQKTTKNKSIFENTEDVNSISLKPYRRLKARLLVDGIDQRILFASLESVTKTYNIRLYGENVSFYDIIKSKKAVDLDLKEYDHYRTFANIKNGRNLTEGYLYPIIDYFADSPNLYVDNSTAKAFVQYLYPAPYYETVIQRIVEDAGYTLDNKLLELPNYPSDGICLPYSSVPFRRNSDMGRYEATIGTSGTQFSPPGGIALNAWTQIDFDTVINSNGYNYYVDFVSLQQALRFIDDINATITFTCTITNTHVAALNVYLAYSTAETVSPPEPPYETISLNAGQSVTHTKTFTLDLIANGVVDANFGLWFTANAGTGSLIEITDAEVTVSDVSAILERPDITYTTDIQGFTTINSLLPDWTQGKLLSNYLKMFLGLISVDESEKKVTLFSLDTVVNNIGQSKDWSDKLDLSEQDELEFDLGYNQINELKYEDDETVIKPFGTDGAILIDDENLNPIDDIVKLDFAASEQVERFNGEYTIQLKMWSNVGSADAAMDEVKQRIAIVRFKDFSFTYNDGVTTQSVTTDVPLPYFIDTSGTLNADINLGFGNNLIDYYKSFIDVIENTKVKKVNIRLNASDINQLDFTKPVYIKHFNSWFYISQIKSYNPLSKQSTECELVKLF